MVKSSSSSTLQYHVRSISLPSRLNPHSIKIETQLNKLKTWEISLFSVVPITADIVKAGLVGLTELYHCLEELVHSPLTQQAFIQYQNGNLIEEALEGSIGLLDSCSIARDLLSVLMENARTLQSIFRRKGDISSIESGISCYISSNKKVKKETAKSLRTLKQMENKIGSTIHFEVNPYLSMVIRVLREVASITISILRLVFLFLSVPICKTKPSRWSLISKAMLKSSPKTNDKIFNELEIVNLSMKRNEIKFDMEVTRKRLEAFDHGLGGLEDGLNLFFRHLIQNRVSLLNIFVQ